MYSQIKVPAGIASTALTPQPYKMQNMHVTLFFYLILHFGEQQSIHSRITSDRVFFPYLRFGPENFQLDINALLENSILTRCIAFA
jgi:hypothetical protein